MNVSYGFATGWYSISPCFVSGAPNLYRLVQLKENNQKEQQKSDKKREIENLHSRIGEGTISIYA